MYTETQDQSRNQLCRLVCRSTRVKLALVNNYLVAYRTI